jgi:hypothetical protein
MATPLTWIEAPARKARPNRSLDVIPVHDVSNEHFVGFQFLADPCGFPSALPQDCYITYGPAEGTPKDFEDPGNPVITDVFGAYQGIECYLNGGIDEFASLAQRMLEAGEHRIVDGRLVGMLSGATPTTPAAAGTIVGAIALLEQYLALEVPGQGYIYMGPAATTYAVANNLIIRNLDGTLETFLGTPIIVITEPSAAGTIWASGPINLWRGPVVVSDSPAWTTNMGRAIAERLYSLAIECGAWKTTFTPPAAEEPPDDPGEPLELNLGSIPSSPIPDGADASIVVQTNVSPENEVFLWSSINGGADTLVGAMIEADSHEFIWEVDGSSTTAGDSIELWAISDYDGNPVESNHITIEVV